MPTALIGRIIHTRHVSILISLGTRAQDLACLHAFRRILVRWAPVRQGLVLPWIFSEWFCKCASSLEIISVVPSYLLRSTVVILWTW